MTIVGVNFWNNVHASVSRLKDEMLFSVYFWLSVSTVKCFLFQIQFILKRKPVVQIILISRFLTPLAFIIESCGQALRPGDLIYGKCCATG